MKRRLEDSLLKGQNLVKLIKAIKTGDIMEAKCSINNMSSEEINTADENGWTALHVAAQEGHKEVCELLLSVSPQTINAADKNGWTALHTAASGGHKEVCELLLSVSPQTINAADKNGYTALYAAAFKGHKEVCELLIFMSPEAINATAKNGSTALQAAAAGGNKKVCELLISMSPQTINAADDYGRTVLHFAASKGHKEVCELLIPKMSPEGVNATDKNGNTALLLAAKASHSETCKVLLGNMHVIKIVELLNQNSNDSPIHKAIGKILADFMKDKFSGNEINPIDLDYYQIKLLKLHQVVDHGLLKSWLSKEGNSSLYISNANKYITKYYFKLIGVCKFVSEDSPILILVNSDCMSQMLSYLAPHSLCPELFAPIELSGESEKVKSENEEGWCTLI